MNRLRSIQALRGLAVLGVVGFHLMTIERKYSSGDLLLPDFLIFGQAGVDLFFVISGFIMVTITRGRFGNHGETVRFLWGRVTRIYPVYWFYYFLTLAVFIIKPTWVNTAEGHQVHLLSSFLLWPTERLPLVMVAWSLIHELWFYLVFTILLFLPERLLLPALFLWGAAVAIANQFVAVPALAPGVRIILHPFSLEFIIGSLIAVYVFQKKIPQLPSVSAALVMLLVLLGGPPLVDAFNVLHQGDLTRSLIFGSLFGLLLLSLVTMERQNKMSIPSPLKNIGDISYTVYLSHILVLSAIGRLWRLAPQAPDSTVDNLIACILMVTAVLGYGWFGFKLIEQPLVNISHRLRTRWFDSVRRSASGLAVNLNSEK